MKLNEWIQTPSKKADAIIVRIMRVALTVILLGILACCFIFRDNLFFRIWPIWLVFLLDIIAIFANTQDTTKFTSTLTENDGKVILERDVKPVRKHFEFERFTFDTSNLTATVKPSKIINPLTREPCMMIELSSPYQSAKAKYNKNREAVFYEDKTEEKPFRLIPIDMEETLQQLEQMNIKIKRAD